MFSLDNIRIRVVGLGYVGLPLACLFAGRYPTEGYDCNGDRVEALLGGHDTTLEVDDEHLRTALASGLTLTTELCRLDESQRDTQRSVFIVAVPTPVDADNRPNLRPLLDASETVGKVIRPGDVVIYESTVYPGVTEEECLPVVEQRSGLTLNRDFYAGYSPERVNPGDRSHTVENICKVTSGSTPEVADFVDTLYRSVLKAGTHKAPSIRVAEASKIVENSQRDVNIAFVNELAKIFNAMGIDTRDVLAAAATKWNFIAMQPGLVGGHCIGVDPYYLIEKAQVYGLLPRIMTNARRLNDGMGAYVANQLVRLMNLKGLTVKDSRILILGFAFKENCPDIRNTKVADIYNTLREYSDSITVYDPWVNAVEVAEEYGIEVDGQEGGECLQNTYDACILAVAHHEFGRLDIRKLVPQPGVVYDVKGVLAREEVDGRL